MSHQKLEKADMIVTCDDMDVVEVSGSWKRRCRNYGKNQLRCMIQLREFVTNSYVRRDQVHRRHLQDSVPGPQVLADLSLPRLEDQRLLV